MKMRRIIQKIIPILDIFFIPIVLPGAIALKLVRELGVKNMPFCKWIFKTVGVFPIRDHYYEPLFKTSNLRKSLREDRELPGIDLNIEEQLRLIDKFKYNDELIKFPLDKHESKSNLRFYYHNGAFCSGDAEYLYNIIRLYKPSKMVEIGSGFSTLIATEAIRKNKQENGGYKCMHICIEPYKNEWLEDIGVHVIRDIVENVEQTLFSSLERNDILFIDSSHIIRPQGDVLVEYLEILPILNAGVLVHIHDIFTPKDYLNEWVIDKVKFWNEQYLLEAFLSLNPMFKVIGALNYLAHNYSDYLASKCPIYKEESSFREPGSFWIVRCE